ncbi:hypothetical protein Q4503_03895 [Colwellia sp. 6_MG-2023]|uniref:hypothetical protein n=1 Tax=Colwellia sp. 6_MG-2023 TaxID=3062676 RepID=UPI0026E1A7F7|nr:hypothetical protein [Colwellia sp. 6_MG-2023]MDO6486830.1 hypothetical protein [Colwellia sp. 6_MG-2023]
MSLESDKVYAVIADPKRVLGHIVKNEFYGKHFSERGPIDINAMDGFVLEGFTLRRSKDDEVFTIVEVDDID